jgi:hypothetical protein
MPHAKTSEKTRIQSYDRDLQTPRGAYKVPYENKNSSTYLSLLQRWRPLSKAAECLVCPSKKNTYV